MSRDTSLIGRIWRKISLVILIAVVVVGGGIILFVFALVQSWK